MVKLMLIVLPLFSCSFSDVDTSAGDDDVGFVIDAGSGSGTIAVVVGIDAVVDGAVVDGAVVDDAVVDGAVVDGAVVDGAVVDWVVLLFTFATVLFVSSI